MIRNGTPDSFERCAGGVSFPFSLVNLLPGALPRYSMPVLARCVWLMAMTLTASEIRPPTWWPFAGIASVETEMAACRIRRQSRQGLRSCLYAVAVVPVLQRRAKVRPIAAQIDALVPESEPLYAVDPDYQPFLFYIRSRSRLCQLESMICRRLHAICWFNRRKNGDHERA